MAILSSELRSLQLHRQTYATARSRPFGDIGGADRPVLLVRRGTKSGHKREVPLPGHAHDRLMSYLVDRGEIMTSSPPERTPVPAAGRTVEATLASAQDMTPGSMKMAKVGERRIVLIRTASGFSALNNACPHQGYGLATGSLDGLMM